MSDHAEALRRFQQLLAQIDPENRNEPLREWSWLCNAAAELCIALDLNKQAGRYAALALSLGDLESGKRVPVFADRVKHGNTTPDTEKLIKERLRSLAHAMNNHFGSNEMPIHQAYSFVFKQWREWSGDTKKASSGAVRNWPKNHYMVELFLTTMQHRSSTIGDVDEMIKHILDSGRETIR